MNNINRNNKLNNGSQLKQQISIDDDNNEQLDAFPSSINNAESNKVNKTTSFINNRRGFRKRSSTESAVMHESPKIQPKERRFSRPLLESSHKNSDKQNRLSKVIEKRHSRLSQHILKYIQLNIRINGENAFVITIEKQKTIEDLIHQIEAEYAFQFIYPKNVNNLKKDYGNLKKDYSEPLITNQQFECNAVMNSEGDILKYTEIVGEVFDMFDTVDCTNVYEDDDTENLVEKLKKELSEDQTQEPESKVDTTENNIVNNVKGIQNVKGAIVKKHRQNHDKIYSMLPNPTLDERFQSILHNKITLNMFYTFCLKEYSVENLLFWLDIEVLQTVNKEMNELYIQYIYYTYIDENAPLQINITEEIKSDIKINELNYSNDDVLEVFDDAQEHIYIMLKIYLYQKFETNPIFKKLQKYKKKHRNEYEKNRILGFYGNYYKPDYETIRNKLDYLKARKSEIKDSRLNFNNLEADSYQTLYQNNWLTTAIADCVVLNNDDELKNYMKTSERRIKEVKNMKLQKGKKLAKFFGEIVDVETLCQQVKKINKQSEESKSDSTLDLTKIKPKDEKKSVQNIKNEFDQEERKRLIRKNEKLNNVLGETLTEEQIKDIIDVDKRKKRLKYLQHFLYSQIDDKEIINEIKIEQEKAVADIRNERRSNKLKKYFGQAPPPDLINTKSEKVENRHRRSIITLTLLMSKENGIINLFNMINDIEKNEEFLDNNSVKHSISKTSNVTDLKIDEETQSKFDLDDKSLNNINKDDNKSIISIDNNNNTEEEKKEVEDDDDDEFNDCINEFPSRKESDITQKSIKDQNEKLYEYYENNNIEYLVEKNIFSTLEQSINEDIDDPKTKEGFKRQITYLRESFIKNSNNIRRMSQMNTSLIKDNSENIWKGSNLLKPMIDNETIVNRDYTNENVNELS
ncbi:hypothetical protein BCR32DRAFT_326818 [Anaeromyces robustus]|uniref:RGS domain-containing protein n=1 Tax=Anaeromyces robustus TaxID=1754192 RepID=A0A1Y1X9V8_9FUNG|nr:hypothetical protein BCR32DRAFT_326818 [Anaeromyces robustus]|eukprot:ORX82507.1 hypothetical protein BCR32DRAFT_326818 [Anaeromyces robustus]